MIELLELKEWVFEVSREDYYGGVYYNVFICKINEVMSKYACKSLAEAGY